MDEEETQEQATETQEQTQQTPPPSPKDDTPKNEFDFNIEEPEEEEEDDENAQIEIDPKFNVPEETRAALKQMAANAKIPVKNASAFVNAMIGASQQGHDALIKTQADELKKEWGDQYKKNVEKTKNFIVSAAQRAGLKDSQLGMLKSPVGMRLMHAIMTATGETKVQTRSVGAGSAQIDAANLTDDQRAAILHDMRHNPQNPYYKGLILASASYQERRKAWEEYNRIAGATIFAF